MQERLQISWLDPGMYTEARLSGKQDNSWLRTLAYELRGGMSERLGRARCMSVKIVDVDLAGNMQGSKRIMRATHPPRLLIDYVVEDLTWNTVREGRVELIDVHYAQHPTDTPLAHEKRLINRWLDEILGPIPTNDLTPWACPVPGLSASWGQTDSWAGRDP